MKKKEKIQLPHPSRSEVIHYLAKWKTLEDYNLQEDSLDILFKDLCPGNKDIKHILLKGSALNDFYSTNIFKMYPVAKHIHSLDIDERLEKGDPTLVNDITNITIKDKDLHFYSFASKYCSHHNPIAYPIYDSYVDKVLRHFRKADKFAKFSNNDLKDYKLFIEVLDKFRSYYGLADFNFKEIDRYLWQLGKEHFNRFKK